MNTDIFLTINSWVGANPFIDAVMIFSAQWLIYILFVVAAACIGYTAYKKQWRDVVLCAVTLIASFAVLFVLSKLFVSERPFVDHTIVQLLPHAANQSFPSDHATASFTLALAILIFTRFKKIGWALLAVAFIIGFARIYAGVHYPLDVIGGLGTALIGAAVALIIAKFLPIKQSVQFESVSNEIK